MRYFSEFLSSEDGAVTVDWVVLTGAIIGFGFLVIFSVSNGTFELMGKVGTTLENAEPVTQVVPIF